MGRTRAPGPGRPPRRAPAQARHARGPQRPVLRRPRGRRLPGAAFPRLRVVLADSKYHNRGLYAWLRGHRRRYAVEVVSRPAGAAGFTPLRKRWVVERTLAWLGRYRRLGRDHERLAETSAA